MPAKTTSMLSANIFFSSYSEVRKLNENDRFGSTYQSEECDEGQLTRIMATHTELSFMHSNFMDSNFMHSLVDTGLVVWVVERINTNAF